jgi:hypothetical protein
MHPRFTIAHMMITIAIVAMALALRTWVSMDSVVGLIAFLILATPIWLIASEMRSNEGARPSRFHTWAFRLYVAAAVFFLIIFSFVNHILKFIISK